MSTKGVVFNGKFLSAPPTGVHRVAAELIRHTDLLLSEGAATGASLPWQLLVPRDVRSHMQLQQIETRTVGRFTWQPWEQFDLPLHARGKVLVSLCNLAPLLTRGGITMIHDAQVFISPESYSKAFLAWYRVAQPLIGKTASRILTVSAFSKDRLVEYGIAPAAKIDVIHNGVDHIALVETDRGVLDKLHLSDRPYVIALANIQKHKNIGVLLKAFAHPSLAAMRLVLVGAETAQSFAEAGMPPPSNVMFAGRVSDGEMRALMEGAVCLGFPSTTEGFGLPPLEAMQVGCPVIAAPCGALPETCGAAAVYVAPDDVQGWVHEISHFADDSARRDSFSARGISHAAQFTWRHSAQRLLDIIQQVSKS